MPVHDDPVPRWRDVLLIAMCGALVSAMLHVLMLAHTSLVRHEFIWFSRDVLWMSPLGYSVFFLAAALPLAVVARLRPRLAPPGVAPFLFTTLTVFATLLPATRITRSASLLLACGIGVQVARLLGRDFARWRKPLRTATLALAAVLGMAGAGERAHRVATERRAIAALTDAPAGTPNVLLLVLDTVRGHDLGFLGYDRPTTPALDRWARDGVVFEQAFSTAPWTFPSHASMFTGLLPRELEFSRRRPLRSDLTFITHILRDDGYLTSAFVANQRFAGWETGLQRGFAHFEDYRTSWRQVLLSTWFGQTEMIARALEARTPREAARSLMSLNLWVSASRNTGPASASEVTDAFLRWRARAPRAPWFTFINYFDAHEPYAPPAPFDTMFGGGRTPRDLYDGEIRFIDSQIDRLLRELERRGELDNTIVILTADHGELFGEHGLYSHGTMLYHPVLHVPLVIRYPGRVPAGMRVSVPSSLRDVGATILELAAVGSTRGFPGRSLSRRWKGEPPAHPIVSELFEAINPDSKMPISRGAMLSLVHGPWHYIRNGDGIEELYEYGTDWQEERNLATMPAFTDSLARFRLEAHRLDVSLGPMRAEIVRR